jgi:hypothetical protein
MPKVPLTADSQIISKMGVNPITTGFLMTRHWPIIRRHSRGSRISNYLTGKRHIYRG